MILTPTSFTVYIGEFLEQLGAKPSVGSALSIYLPSLLLLLYQQIILPLAVTFLVKLEKHHNQAEATNSSLRKFLFYLAFYVFLYPLLGLQFYQIIEMILGSDKA